MIVRYLFIMVLGTFLFLGGANEIRAVTCDITVRPGQSIQANGINRVAVGGTVCVQYGTYHESLKLDKE